MKSYFHIKNNIFEHIKLFWKTLKICFALFALIVAMINNYVFFLDYGKLREDLSLVQQVSNSKACSQ